MHLLEEANFKKTVATGNYIIDFFAEWCGPCKMLTPILEELATEISEKVSIYKIDIDQCETLPGELQIASVPTLIYFKDGKEVERIVGVKDKEELLDIVNQIF